jgi:phosphoglucosamine mutase
VKSARTDVLEVAGVRAAIAAGHEALEGTGRLFIRASGTEPLIRVMAEGDDRHLVEQVAARVAGVIEKEIARLA